MKRVFRLIRGGRHERVALVSSGRDNVWRILPGGNSSFLEGDVVCARRPVSILRAAKRVASWRTRVTPQDLVLLKGEYSLKPRVSPYTQLVDSVEGPDSAA